MKRSTVEKHFNKFVRMRFLAKGEMSFITGTITEINGIYLWLNVNDEKEKQKVYYNNILRIYEISSPNQIMFRTLQKKAEQYLIKSDYEHALKVYEKMLEIATGKNQKRICSENIKIINEKLNIEVKA